MSKDKRKGDIDWAISPRPDQGHPRPQSEMKLGPPSPNFPKHR